LCGIEVLSAPTAWVHNEGGEEGEGSEGGEGGDGGDNGNGGNGIDDGNRKEPLASGAVSIRFMAELVDSFADGAFRQARVLRHTHMGRSDEIVQRS